MYITNTISTETLELLDAKTNNPLAFVRIATHGTQTAVIWFNKALGGRNAGRHKPHPAIKL